LPTCAMNLNFLEPNRTSLEPSSSAPEAKINDEEEKALRTTLEASSSAPEAKRNDEEEKALLQHEPTTRKTIVYDFVVIGNGNAGQSAIKELRKQCPKARIAVIDPLRSASTAKDKVDYFRETVTGFHPSARTVQLLRDPETQLQYRYGVLVATGARGAPPPIELFEENALSRVLELRTTELVGNKKRPVMAPEMVRQKVIKAASKGAKIGILGSGWEALDLAVIVAATGKQKPTLVFGHSGPALNILPQYLSSELRKKLRNSGMDIQDRSILRYIAENNSNGAQKIEMHTAKTYDLLETRRTSLDLLVGKNSSDTGIYRFLLRENH
jgi:pyruvate/2-oxoglutarate dehydrogenase complex dihydrolipoamide dehydrogenase (E3) component